MEKTNINKDGIEYCFSYSPDGAGGFKIIKLHKGVKGYIPQDYCHFKNQADIEKEVAEMNLDFLGLDKEATRQIELSVL